MPSRSPRVALASLPWTNVDEPSLGLALLKESLSQAGIASKVYHLNIGFLRHIRAETYSALSDLYAVNDFLFSHAISGAASERQLHDLRRSLDDPGVREKLALAGYGDDEAILAMFDHVRTEVVPDYLSACADELLHDAPTLVGLTCMFDQTLPSIALAKVLRGRGYEGRIALGGYAVREPLASEILRVFPEVDAIAQGAGETTIVALAHASVAAGDAYRDCLGGAALSLPPEDRAAADLPAPRHDIERSPVPDYGDWFDQVRALSRDDAIDINLTSLPIELSRGCWWGQKNHCVFCGIAPEEMSYRRKTADLALSQIRAIASRHDSIQRIRVNDYILPLDYITDLAPRLTGEGLRFSCETKANLKYAQLETLAKAGFVEIQPGIESFSREALASMRKGVSPLQNIAFLVHGQALGITVYYNIIYDFPFDAPGHYDWMLDAIPSLYHLRPPMSLIPVQITRDAPLHRESARFGGPDTPAISERYSMLEAGGVDGAFLEAYAYYFERYHDTHPELVETFKLLEQMVAFWRDAYHARKVSLTAQLVSGCLHILDTRYRAPRTHVLDELESRIVRFATERPRSLHSDATLRALGHPGPTELGKAVERLKDLRLIVEMDDVLLSVVPMVVDAERGSAMNSGRVVSVSV